MCCAQRRGRGTSTSGSSFPARRSCARVPNATVPPLAALDRGNPRPDTKPIVYLANSRTTTGELPKMVAKPPLPSGRLASARRHRRARAPARAAAVPSDRRRTGRRCGARVGWASRSKAERLQKSIISKRAPAATLIDRDIDRRRSRSSLGFERPGEARVRNPRGLCLARASPGRPPGPELCAVAVPKAPRGTGELPMTRRA